MISSISVPSSGYMTASSSMTSAGRSEAALHSTPSRSVNYSPQIQSDSPVQQSSKQRFVQSKDSMQPEGNGVNKKEPPVAESNTDEAQKEREIAQVVAQLKSRDTEVRTHEMAHLAAAGSYATGMNFTYQVGPDGKQYAVGGEVGIDVSAVSGNPEATFAKAQVVQRAALAPAEPSGQDLKVAAAAQKMMLDARAEITAKALEETAEEKGETEDGNLEEVASKAPAMVGLQPSADEKESAGLRANLLPERELFDTRVSLQQAMR